MRMLLTASFFTCTRILRPALGQMSQTTGHLNRHARHVPAIHGQGTWKKERQRCMDASDIGCSADKVELPAPPCVRTGTCRNLPRPPGRCWWLEAAAGDHPPGSHKLQVSFSSRAPRRTVRSPELPHPIRPAQRSCVGSMDDLRPNRCYTPHQLRWGSASVGQTASWDPFPSWSGGHQKTGAQTWDHGGCWRSQETHNASCLRVWGWMFGVNVTYVTWL